MKVVLDDGAFMPVRAHEDDAGLDLFAMESFAIWPHSKAMTDTGVHVEIPVGYAGLVKSKSGIMKNKSVTVDGTIDVGYTGSINVVMFNHSDEKVFFEAGTKIAQLVLVKIITPTIEVVHSLDKTDRGDCGFGSTGER